jgi:hypothetical protein
MIHYWNRRLCRVAEALGKALKTLGRVFVECRTRQRGLGTQCIGKTFFVEYFFRALDKDFAECQEVLGKEKQPSRRRVTETVSLPSVCRQHSAKNPSAESLCQVLCRVLCMTLGKASFFAECQSHCTRQRTYTGAQVFVLCRVLWS